MKKIDLKEAREFISCDECGAKNMGYVEHIAGYKYPVHTVIKCSECKRNYSSLRPEKEEASAFKIDLSNAKPL